MKMLKIVCLILLFCFGSCSNNGQLEIDTIDKQILHIHDEVMPRMGEVLSLRKQIQYKLDSCQTLACSDTLNKISYALTKADADMMKWMRAYRKPEFNDTAISYLQRQLKEVELVKTQILDGISHAKIYLDNNEK